MEPTEEQIEVAQGVFKPMSECTKAEIQFHYAWKEMDQEEKSQKKTLLDFLKRFRESIGDDPSKKLEATYNLGVMTLHVMDIEAEHPFSEDLEALLSIARRYEEETQEPADRPAAPIT